MKWVRGLLPDESRILAVFVLSGALLGFINILFGPLILHKVGLSAYGSLGLAMFTHSLLFTLAEFGVQAHLVSVLANKSKDMAGEIASTLVFKIAAYLLALVAFGAYCLYYPHPKDVKAIVAVYMLVSLFSTTHAEWYFIGNRKYWELAKSRFLSALISITLITGWFFWGQGLWFIPFCSALSQIAGIAYLVSRTGFREKLAYFKKASWVRIRGLFRELFPMAATQTLSPFFMASGIFLLDRLHFSKEFIGAYNIPQRVILGWISLFGPLVLYFIPKMVGKNNSVNFGRHAWYSLVSATMLLPIGIAVIHVFYRFSGANPYFEGFSLKAYAILSLGIFFSMLRIRHVSRMVYNQNYGRYFFIHLVACIPILYLGFVQHPELKPLDIPWLVCLPELLATTLFLIMGDAPSASAPVAV